MCPPSPEAIANIPGFSVVTFRATIEARAEQCGTSQKTTRAEGLVFSEELPEVELPSDVANTEQITMQGCGETAPASSASQEERPQQPRRVSKNQRVAKSTRPLRLASHCLASTNEGQKRGPGFNSLGPLFLP
jgi:hypothetical protein